MLFSWRFLMLITFVTGQQEEEEKEKVDEGILEINVTTNIINLNKGNFDSFLIENKYVFVNFYAPWCSHCKSFSSEYYDLEELMMKENTLEVKLAGVDCVEQSELADKHEILAYPTLILYEDSNPIRYDGPLNKENISIWMKKMIHEFGLEELQGIKDLKNLTEKDNFVIFTVFDETDKDPDVLHALSKVAKRIPSCTLYKTNDSTIKNIYEVENKGLVMVRSFEKPSVVHYQGNLTSDEEILKWIQYYSVPIMLRYKSSKSLTKLGNTGIKYHLYYIDKNLNSAPASFKKSAKSLRGKYVSIYADGNGGNVKSLLTFLKIDSTQLPMLAIVQNDGSRKWTKRVENDLKFSDIEKFITEFETGNLKRRSEPLPENWDQGPVVTLVMDNFEQVVYDKNKVVFVKFYLPNCGACKDVAPIWEELGKTFSGNDEVIIAQINARPNDIPDELGIEKFPSFVLFDKENSKFQFKRKRVLDEFIKFTQIPLMSTFEQTNKKQLEDKEGKNSSSSRHEEL